MTQWAGGPHAGLRVGSLIFLRSQASPYADCGRSDLRFTNFNDLSALNALERLQADGKMFQNIW